MYEKVKEFLIDSGYKKFNTSSFITVRDDMLFTISPQGIKNDIYVWHAIYPLALPDLWINMGWPPASRRSPKNSGLTYTPELIDNTIINEIKNHVFPFFDECKTLADLNDLLVQGDFRASYPRIFTLLSMKNYSQGLKEISRLIKTFDLNEKKICQLDSFVEMSDLECWGSQEQDTVRKYAALKTQKDLEQELNIERERNIKKHKLVRFIKKLNLK